MKNRQRKSEGVFLSENSLLSKLFTESVTCYARTDSAITLISLIVTAIILLILAAVSINLISGTDGILSKGGKAVDETIIAQEKEQIQLIVTACRMNEANYIMGIPYSEFEKEFKDAYGSIATVTGTNERPNDATLISAIKQLLMPECYAAEEYRYAKVTYNTGRKYYICLARGLEPDKIGQIFEDASNIVTPTPTPNPPADDSDEDITDEIPDIPLSSIENPEWKMDVKYDYDQVNDKFFVYVYPYAFPKEISAYEDFLPWYITENGHSLDDWDYLEELYLRAEDKTYEDDPFNGYESFEEYYKEEAQYWGYNTPVQFLVEWCSVLEEYEIYDEYYYMNCEEAEYSNDVYMKHFYSNCNYKEFDKYNETDFYFNVDGTETNITVEFKDYNDNVLVTKDVTLEKNVILEGDENSQYFTFRRLNTPTINKVLEDAANGERSYYTYLVQNGYYGYEITGYSETGKQAIVNGQLSTLTLPTTYNNLPVRGVARFAITNEGEINEQNYQYGNYVNKVVVPGNIKAISTYGIALGGSNLELQEGIEYLAEDAFFLQGEMSYIKLPDSVMYAGRLNDYNSMAGFSVGQNLEYVSDYFYHLQTDSSVLFYRGTLEELNEYRALSNARLTNYDPEYIVDEWDIHYVYCLEDGKRAYQVDNQNYSSGYSSGYDSGYSSGYDSGYSSGYDSGECRYKWEEITDEEHKEYFSTFEPEVKGLEKFND